MNHEIIFDSDIELPDELTERMGHVITAALKAEGVELPCEINVLITGDEGIHQINLDMREVDRPTDVLSFPVFDLLPGEHPIVPVMLYDPHTAHEFARRMLDKGVYVVAFCYPVVPRGRDRIRTQISAGHTKEDLDFAIRCFGEVKEEMGL